MLRSGHTRVTNKRLTRTLARAGRLFLAGAGCGILLAGCGGDSTPPSACNGALLGHITGVVLAGAHGAPGIKVMAWEVGGHDDQRVTATADSLGRYDLALPAGAWIMSLQLRDDWGHPIWSDLYYSRHGVVVDRRDADTITVARPSAGGLAPMRADFLCSSMKLQVQLPPELQAEDLYCSLLPVGRAQGLSNDSSDRGEAGTFAFPLLAPGSYRAEIRSGWPVTFLPGAYDTTGATVFTVGPGQDASFASEIPVRARISGSVHGSWERMDLPAPVVCAFTADSLVVRHTRAGDGLFDLDFYGPARVRLGVSFENTGRGAFRWIGGDTFEEAPFFTLSPGEVTGGVALTECGILCRFVVAGGSVPARHWVRVIDAAGRTVVDAADLDNPEIRIPGLKPGSYRLQVHRLKSPLFFEEWLPQWYDGADSSGATPVTLAAPGALAEVTFHLERGATVSGRVRDRGGMPLFNCQIYLSHADPPPALRGDFSGPDGGFQIPGVEDGNYYLGVRAPDGLVYWHPGTAVKDSATVVRVRNHEDVSGLDWRVR